MRISKNPEERKAELIAAARYLFDKNGVENTRISDIVRRVGVAQGVFYYYFSSKEEMVNTVLQQVQQELQVAIQLALSDETASFAQKLAALIELYLQVVDQFTADDVESLPALSQEAQQNPYLKKATELLTSRLVRLVVKAAQQGEVKAAYPKESVLVTLYGLRAFAAHSMPSRLVIYTLAEQNLCMPKGALTQYVNK